CELDQTTRTNEKSAALESYFRAVPAADAAWALQFLCGRTLPRAVPTKSLWQWTADETQLPEWLIGECYDAVGDMAETMALLMRNSGGSAALSLSEIVEQRLVPLRNLPEGARRDLLLRTWRELDPNERLVWNKLITGNFRVGVARTLVIRALASVADVEPAVMAHRVMGSWLPTSADFSRLMSTDKSAAPEIARPYPFYLASPLEVKLKQDENIAALGDVRDWFAEWKWDGIRAQLIRRRNETLVWSRGDEMVTDTFPEIVEAGRHLPEGTVLDGEILAWAGEAPLPFARLQRRLGRKQVGAKTRLEFPVAFVAYDLLELDGKDLRGQPLEWRRKQLEEILNRASLGSMGTARSSVMPAEEAPLLPGLEAPQALSDTPVAASFPLRLSPLISASSWQEVGELQRQARVRGVEGLMLKNRLSTYGVGRQRGDWWKWKIDPFLIDAVLIAAQLGHGRRASLYTDYTFGLWDGGVLVPVAKAYSGLTDEEILQVDHFVRHHTVGKFGPVRSVSPTQVFELAFEGIQKSSRHKSGVAVRFPRMNRWRQDKKAEEADTIENLRALARFEGGGQ
ncbi:MAG: ligase 1, partial [Verrucomicrobiota bacterium]